MSPEKQRIAIAEAIGWSATCTTSGVDIRWAKWSLIPDYLNDLNAMHEAEKVLTQEQRTTYCYHLLPNGKPSGIEREDCWLCSHATAAQRAEAFLRTIGKWTDDN